MPSTNSFFTATTGYSGEQTLVDNLVIEQIGIYGLDLLYMPRENLNLDDLLHESTESIFRTALSIPMYLKSFDGYDNSMEMLTKFGVRSSDEITLVMSRSQWYAFYAPYIKSVYNADSGREQGKLNNPLQGELARRPKEGDVVYFPYDGGMFEVKYVQFDQPFYQLGKGYVFEMQCEKFEYSGENFDTGYDQIDTVNIRSAFPDLQLEMIEGGTGSFETNERVKVWNLTQEDIASLSTQSDQPLLSDDLSFIDPDGIDFFQLYNDSGFLDRAITVEGTVSRWNARELKLNLQDLSDMNPDRLDLQTGNVSINDFDTVLVIGQKTGASWMSRNAGATPKAFNDAETIQEQFDEIKVYDVSDTNAFGFY